MRKIFIMALILMLFFTCASVSAEDAISDDIVAMDDAVDEAVAVEEDQAIEQSSDEETLAADEGTFTQLQEQVNNADPDSTITLDKNYTYNDGFTATGISFDRPLTIDGNGFTVNANRQGRIFNIGDYNVVIKNMFLINADYNDGFGGAMYGGTAINCTFIKDHAFDGGAMYSASSKVSAINCTFINNSAVQYGGAINQGIAKDCKFYDNDAGICGALYNGTAINCTFNNNTASDYGGAMSGYAENCTFTNNIADYEGGLSGTAVNCTFTNNTAKQGGAMGGSAVNCTFIGNQAINSGGAMGGSAVNCTFIGNQAINSGGAMCGNSAVNCTFIGNHARSGGAVCAIPVGEDYIFSAENCTFKNNSAMWAGAMSGGSALNCSFINNYARYTGGAISEVSAVNCTFINNTEGFTYVDVTAKNTTYNKNAYLVVTLKDSQGKPIAGKTLWITTDGMRSYKTDKNGQVRINLGKLRPNKYSVEIEFNGDDFYAALDYPKIVPVVVKKATPKITAKTKTFKKKVKVKKYTITLKNNIKKVMKKTKVYIKVKGKTYSAKTNSKGKATFKIKNLKKKGTFKAVVTYKGNKYYNKVTKKVKIKVK